VEALPRRKAADDREGRVYRAVSVPSCRLAPSEGFSKDALSLRRFTKIQHPARSGDSLTGSEQG
jgi:hypothetical protein